MSLTHPHTLIPSQTDSAVIQLREAALEIVNIPPLSGPSGEQLVRLEELEGLTTVQERELSRLTGQVRWRGGV